MRNPPDVRSIKEANSHPGNKNGLIGNGRHSFLCANKWVGNPDPDFSRNSHRKPAPIRRDPVINFRFSISHLRG
ncbi:hypothetical protein TNCT_179381 [Trichonephila clavata]|uniref:Uncharacterized protein n=1 Tax=Trichonephila clavata TaxID=2740835 RepID=A0A8X6GIK4_TRICU|nr:hypothetical protein TNCT_179381 [Trichonephila clavata]